MSPIALNAEVYNALCDGIESSSSDNNTAIVVSKCQITLSGEGFIGGKDFIPKDNISQWNAVRQDDNFLLGAAGAASGTYT